MRCNTCACCLVIVLFAAVTFVSLPFIFQRDGRPHVVLKRVVDYLDRIEKLDEKVTNGKIGYSVFKLDLA